MLGEEFAMVQVKDLAVAFSLHWVATVEPLFGWYKKQYEDSFIIRGVGGALTFFSDGLQADATDGVNSGINVGVSALVSPE